MSMGADTKANTQWAAAHLRWEIIVSLRTAASAEAPSSLMSLSWRLQSMGEVGSVRDQACQWALTRKQTLYGRAAHMTVLTAWFLDKSNASSFASAASGPQSEKSMSVCSGWRPQRVMIWGISETTDRMASTPLPSELLSRLRWGKTRCQGAH